jgi:acyl carrier protein
MKADRDEVLNYVLQTIEELLRDWDNSSAIDANSLLFTGLGMESLDVVVLGTSIQEHFQFQMPLAELLADVGQREVRDLSIGELVDFVDLHLNGKPSLMEARKIQ